MLYIVLYTIGIFLTWFYLVIIKQNEELSFIDIFVVSFFWLPLILFIMVVISLKIKITLFKLIYDCIRHHILYNISRLKKLFEKNYK